MIILSDNMIPEPGENFEGDGDLIVEELREIVAEAPAGFPADRLGTFAVSFATIQRHPDILDQIEDRVHVFHTAEDHNEEVIHYWAASVNFQATKKRGQLEVYDLVVLESDNHPYLFGWQRWDPNDPIY